MRHDWDRIRAEYISGSESLRSLAAKHKVSLSSLGTRAAREDWAEARDTERKRVRGMAMARSRERRVKREAAALERVEGQIERIIGEIERALEDGEQLYRHIIYVGKGKQDEQVLAKLDTKAARDYVAMLHELKEMLDEYNGTIQKREREELKLKKARLKLDTQKAGLQGSVDEGETGVIMMPPLDNGPVEELVIGGEETGTREESGETDV